MARKIDVSAAAAALGRKGGAVTGPSKRRGDAAHYSALARSAARESIEVTNDFHSTRVTLRPRDGWLSVTQVRRARRALCPSRASGCTCGASLGERGRQSWEYVDARADGTVKVSAKGEGTNDKH